MIMQARPKMWRITGPHARASRTVNGAVVKVVVRRMEVLEQYLDSWRICVSIGGERPYYLSQRRKRLYFTSMDDAIAAAERWLDGLCIEGENL